MGKVDTMIQGKLLIGELWRDDSRRKTLEEKVKTGAEMLFLKTRKQYKFCWCSPEILGEEKTIDSYTLRGRTYDAITLIPSEDIIIASHFWYTNEKESDVFKVEQVEENSEKEKENNE